MTFSPFATIPRFAIAAVAEFAAFSQYQGGMIFLRITSRLFLLSLSSTFS